MLKRCHVLVVLALLLGGSRAHADTVSVPGSYATIQAAIDHAPEGAIIQILPGRYHEHLNLTTITRTLTVQGDAADPGAVVLDGDGVAGPVVKVMSTGSNVVFVGLTITGGAGGEGVGGGLLMGRSEAIFRRCVFTGNSSVDGGGAFILTSGGLFQDCVFQGNSASRFGGGVLLNVGATTVFEQCRFLDNESGTGDVVSGWGGGLHVNDSSPTLVNCLIRDNHAKFAGGGLSVTGHFTVPQSILTLRDVTIESNAVVAAPGQPPAQGGGLHVEDNVLAVLERCRVRSNTANTGGGLSAYRSHYTVADSVIEGNALTPMAGGGFGAGVYAVSVNTAAPARPPATVKLERSVVRDNTGDVGAGIFVQGDFMLTANQAALDLNDSLVEGNIASGRGAGVFVDRTVAAIRRSHILGNQVTALHDSWGGGLATVGSSLTTVDGSTIADNVVAELGGGIYADQGGRLDVTDSRLFGNRAGASGGLGGGAIAVAQATGPAAGPVTGTVASSVLRENGPGFEIWESNCANWSTIVYRDNSIHDSTGGVYYRNCTGATATVAAFNAVAGKASGNVDARPAFVSFLAAPTTLVTGSASVLSWSTAASGALTIDSGVGAVAGPTATIDVSPAVTTTYDLTVGTTAASPVTVTVACAALGTPIPRSPGNGNAGQTPGAVTLAWYPASGAESYDVYLDTTDVPSAVVAQGTTGTSTVVSSLAPETVYRWRVVARSSQCATPGASPVFSFQTCASAGCAYVDTFDDGDVSDWKRIGKGTARVANSSLHLSAKRLLKVLPPVPEFTDGSVSLTLVLESGRREARLLFGYVDERNYRELVLAGSKGRLKLGERSKGRRRTSSIVRRALPTGVPLSVRVELDGNTATVFLDDAEVLTKTFAQRKRGRFAIASSGGAVTVDDLRIAAAGTAGVRVLADPSSR